MKLFMGMTMVTLAACGAATPSATQEKGVMTDAELQAACVAKAKASGAETSTEAYKIADDCTNAVRATRPIPVYADGGK